MIPSEICRLVEGCHWKKQILTLEHTLNPFTPKSDQLQVSPAASPEILHHTEVINNLAFHRLLRWKTIILPILTTSLRHFSLKGLENLLFEFGSERVKMVTHFTVKKTSLITLNTTVWTCTARVSYCIYHVSSLHFISVRSCWVCGRLFVASIILKSFTNIKWWIF